MPTRLSVRVPTTPNDMTIFSDDLSRFCISCPLPLSLLSYCNPALLCVFPCNLFPVHTVPLFVFPRAEKPPPPTRTTFPLSLFGRLHTTKSHGFFSCPTASCYLSLSITSFAPYVDVVIYLLP